MPLFTLSSLTCHRFIIASITVSSKGLCDSFCTNNLYAKVGGISVTELNILEREFLSAIDWRLTVSSFSLYYLLCNPAESHAHLVFKSSSWFILVLASAHVNFSRNTTSISSEQTARVNSSSPVPSRQLQMATSKWVVDYPALHRLLKLLNFQSAIDHVVQYMKHLRSSLILRQSRKTRHVVQLSSKIWHSLLFSIPRMLVLDRCRTI